MAWQKVVQHGGEVFLRHLAACSERAKVGPWTKTAFDVGAVICCMFSGGGLRKMALPWMRVLVFGHRRVHPVPHRSGIE